MDHQNKPKFFRKKLPLKQDKNILERLNNGCASVIDLPKIAQSSESTSPSEEINSTEIKMVSSVLNDSSTSFGELSRTSCCGSSHSESSTEMVSTGINTVPCHSKEGAKWTKIRQYQERNKRREARIKRERKKERKSLKKKSGRKKKSGKNSSSSSSSSAKSKKKHSSRRKPKKKTK